jgi:hypothetical protein
MSAARSQYVRTRAKRSITDPVRDVGPVFWDCGSIGRDLDNTKFA